VESGGLLLIVVSALIFGAVMLGMQSLYWAVVTNREHRDREIARRLGTVVSDDEALLVARRREAEIDPDSLRASINSMLVQAGRPFTFSALMVRVVVFMGVGATVSVLALKSPMGVIGALFGLYPIANLRGKAIERMEKLTEQLPEALDLMARSLRAGHGISEAMRVVAEELPVPVAAEFGRAYEEHNLGMDFRVCLERLVERNAASFDLRIFVSSVLLQRETGGNLIEILENIARTIRERFIFQGKVRALTAEARITAIILGSLPFLVGGAILYVRPTYLRLLTVDPFGRVLLIYAAVSFVVGVFVLSWLSKVDV